MMTLHELKNRVQVADTRVAVPKKAELLEMGVDIVVKELIDTNVEISVFANGYVLYTEGIHSTVFRLHDCNSYNNIRRFSSTEYGFNISSIFE